MKHLPPNAAHTPPTPVDEPAQSPARMIARRFLANKTAMLGLITFVLIFAIVFGLSALFPLDLTYQDVTHQDVAPGFAMAKLPAAMQSNPRAATFLVGADSGGMLHACGNLTERQKKLPQDARDIVKVSARLDHMLALDVNERVYT